MAFWQIAFLLSLVAALFVLWPLVKLPFLRKSAEPQTGYDETQVILYQEHLADMEKSLALGEIDEAQFAELKLELQKALVNETRVVDSSKKTSVGGKRVVIAAAIVIPLLSLLLYARWGAKADWEIYQDMEALPLATSQEDYQARMRELSARVQSRLNRTPDNTAMLNLLAQLSMAVQDYDLAVYAYRKILDQFPNSPGIISNLAQAMFHRAGNVVTPEVRDYTSKALELAPMLPEMLGLAGIDAKNQGDYREAIRYWKMAVSQMNPESRAAQGYMKGIQSAEQALVDAGEDPTAAAAEAPAADGEASAADKGSETDGDADALQVNVRVGDQVTLRGDETVFVYARAWGGPRMPLAIRKLSVSELPTRIALDESMAMAPGMSIKSYPELEVVVRISRSGDPAPQSGDWQATMGPVRLAGKDNAIDLTVNEQIP